MPEQKPPGYSMWDITMSGLSGVFTSMSSRVRDIVGGALGKLGFTIAYIISRSMWDHFCFFVGVATMNSVKFKYLNEGNIFTLTYRDDVKYKKVKCLQLISKNVVNIEYV